MIRTCTTMDGVDPRGAFILTSDPPAGASFQVTGRSNADAVAECIRPVYGTVDVTIRVSTTSTSVP